jgi:hypothetical protein
MSFKQKYLPDNGSVGFLGKSVAPPPSCLARVPVAKPVPTFAEHARTPDVGGDCAVYMMAEPPECLCEQGFRAFPGRSFAPQNLDAPPLCPYTSAVPEMDVNLNPRAAPPKGFRMGRGWKRILPDVAAL